ncbi:ph domain-like protein [Diplodia corticola]|uniref:Ph domain-like protein n=1 Tax=Diplodia corticola TaxID=236234 RepID=A0A1J9SL03_9PEZI|nr:ph domain-like protein [Diplodia corticola]OJD40301.1 ph domain-like protein [Diplodia corticola]
MSYSQPYRPRPQRPDRTPSTDNAIPFPPGAPTAAPYSPQQYPPQPYSPQPYSPQPYSQPYSPQPRIPFSPESPRPGSSASHRPRPGPGPYQYPSRTGTASPQQAYRPPTASSYRSNTYGSPAPASPHRPDYQRSAATSPRLDNRPGTASSSRSPHPSFGPQQPFSSPGFANDGTPSPLSQATTQVDLHDVALGPPQEAPKQLDRPPTLPPAPPGVPAPTTHSRFSDASAANALAASRFRSPDQYSWPRMAQWTLLPLILMISGAVAILMGHSLSLYGGLKVDGTIDNTVSTHPVWPSDLSLLPSWLLLAVGFTSFCCSIIVWGLSLRERFMKPVKRLAGVRVGMGIFFVGAWIAALAVYKLFETGAGGDSLSAYACEHASDNVTGASEIARVCTEQNAGFALAIASAILELALIGCFAIRTLNAKKDNALSEKL